MARQSIVAQVEEIVEPIAHRSGLEVADVELLGQGSRTVLRVVVESAGESAPDVTVEELARVPEVLSRQLDLRDLIPHAYSLEVSSPGLDRPLKKDRDFVRFAGREIEVWTFAPIENQRHFKGRLLGLGGGIGQDGMFEALEAALLSAYKKNFGGGAQNVRIEIDRTTGDMRVYQVRTVAEQVTDPTNEIALAEVQQYDPTAVVGDTVELEVTPRDFGRIAAQTAKQVWVQRLREAERELVYKEFRDREGDIVTGTVHRIERKNVYLDLGRIEAVLPPPEQIPRESYRQGERVKAYVVEVRQGTRGPQIVVSRTHPGLLKRLFELEVPEIYEGLVEIKAIAREGGPRSKIAVASRDRNVD